MTKKKITLAIIATTSALFYISYAKSSRAANPWMLAEVGN